MADPWKSMGSDLQSFGRKTAAVTPGADDLPTVAKAIVVIADGDVTVVPVDNADADTVTFTSVSAGQVLPLIVRRVTAATATVIAVVG